MLPRLQQAVLNGKIHGMWFLIPSSSQTPMPLLDGTAVPVTSSNQWARSPKAGVKTFIAASELLPISAGRADGTT